MPGQRDEKCYFFQLSPKPVLGIFVVNREHTSLVMNKLSFLLLLICGIFCHGASAQFFLGVGANVQFTSLKDSYRSADVRTFTGQGDAARITWSPSVRTEYVLSANSYLSGTFSHFSIKDFGYEVSAPRSVFVADRINAIQGRFMAGWVFDHFGLEGGVVLLQSYTNERTLVTAPTDPLSSIADVRTSDKGFTQLYPCISVTYKYGQWLGVLSGTFSSDRYNPSNQQLITVVPQASISLGVFYLWKAMASPRLTSPRF